MESGKDAHLSEIGSRVPLHTVPLEDDKQSIFSIQEAQNEDPALTSSKKEKSGSRKKSTRKSTGGRPLATVLPSTSRSEETASTAASSCSDEIDGGRLYSRGALKRLEKCAYGGGFKEFLARTDDGDIKDQFEKIKKTASIKSRTFAKDSTAEERFLQAARILYNRSLLKYRKGFEEEARNVLKESCKKKGPAPLYADIDHKKKLLEGVDAPRMPVSEIRFRDAATHDAEKRFNALQDGTITCSRCPSTSQPLTSSHNLMFHLTAHHEVVHLYACHFCGLCHPTQKALANHTCDQFQAEVTGLDERQKLSMACCLQMLVCSCCGLSVPLRSRLIGEASSAQWKQLVQLHKTHNCNSFVPVQVYSRREIPFELHLKLRVLPSFLRDGFPISCAPCGIDAFDSTEQLYHHFASQHGADGKQCPGCERQFQDEVLFRHHLMSHLPSSLALADYFANTVTSRKFEDGVARLGAGNDSDYDDDNMVFGGLTEAPEQVDLSQFAEAWESTTAQKEKMCKAIGIKTPYDYAIKQDETSKMLTAFLKAQDPSFDDETYVVSSHFYTEDDVTEDQKENHMDDGVLTTSPGTVDGPLCNDLCDSLVDQLSIMCGMKVTQLTATDVQDNYPGLYDAIFVCARCSCICEGNHAAIAHFLSCCSDEVENAEQPELDLANGKVRCILPAGCLPNSPIMCPEPRCYKKCCSILGLRGHLAMAHGILANHDKAVRDSSTSVQRIDPSTCITREINMFCGLTPDGFLPVLKAKKDHLQPNQRDVEKPPTAVAADDVMVVEEVPLTLKRNYDQMTSDQPVSVINRGGRIATKLATAMWAESSRSRETPPGEDDEEVDKEISPVDNVDVDMVETVHVGMVEQSSHWCDFCGLKLLTDRELQKHLKQHTECSELVCYLCTPPKRENISSLSHLRRHVEYTHTNNFPTSRDGMAECGFCARSMPLPQVFRHLYYDCYMSPCALCGNACNKAADRTRHQMKEHRLELTRFSCACKENFANYDAFLAHICKERKGIQCGVCKAFFEKEKTKHQEASAHFLNTHVKNGMCQVCDTKCDSNHEAAHLHNGSLIVTKKLMISPKCSPKLFANVATQHEKTPILKNALKEFFLNADMAPKKSASEPDQHMDVDNDEAAVAVKKSVSDPGPLHAIALSGSAQAEDTPTVTSREDRMDVDHESLLPPASVICLEPASSGVISPEVPVTMEPPASVQIIERGAVQTRSEETQDHTDRSQRSTSGSSSQITVIAEDDNVEESMDVDAAPPQSVMIIEAPSQPVSSAVEPESALSALLNRNVNQVPAQLEQPASVMIIEASSQPPRSLVDPQEARPEMQNTNTVDEVPAHPEAPESVMIIEKDAPTSTVHEAGVHQQSNENQRAEVVSERIGSQGSEPDMDSSVVPDSQRPPIVAAPVVGSRPDSVMVVDQTPESLVDTPPPSVLVIDESVTSQVREEANDSPGVSGQAAPGIEDDGEDILVIQEDIAAYSQIKVKRSSSPVPPAVENNVVWQANEGDDEIMVGEPAPGSKTTGSGRRKTLKCSSCSEMFLTESRRKHHFNTTHSADVSTLEKLCEEDFGIPAQLVVSICRTCNIAFEDRQQFERHDRWHRSKTPAVGCPHCSGVQLSELNQKEHLQKHMSTLYADRIKYVCIQCNPTKTFFDESQMMYHLMQAHRATILYFCKNCLRGSINGSYMYHHVMTGECLPNRPRRDVNASNMGLTCATQLMFQPKNVEDHKRQLSINPHLFVVPSECTHRSFIRFGNMFTPCTEKHTGGCYGLTNYNRWAHTRTELPLNEDMPLSSHSLFKWLELQYRRQQQQQQAPMVPQQPAVPVHRPVMAAAQQRPAVAQPLPARKHAGATAHAVPTSSCALSGPLGMLQMQILNQQQQRHPAQAAVPAPPPPNQLHRCIICRGTNSLIWAPLAALQSIVQNVQRLPRLSERNIEVGMIFKHRTDMLTGHGFYVCRTHYRPTMVDPTTGHLRADARPEYFHEATLVTAIDNELRDPRLQNYFANLRRQFANIGSVSSAGPSTSGANRAVPSTVNAPRPGLVTPVRCCLCQTVGPMSAHFLVQMPPMGADRNNWLRKLSNGAPLNIIQHCKELTTVPVILYLCLRHFNPEKVLVGNDLRFILQDTEGLFADYHGFVKDILRYPINYLGMLMAYSNESKNLASPFNKAVQFLSGLKQENRCKNDSCGNAVLRSTADIRKHQMHASPDSWACTLCWHRSKNEVEAVKHALRDHCNDVNRVTYCLRCPVRGCADQFQDVLSLRRHVNKTHRAELGNESDFCATHFASPQQATVHDVGHKDGEITKCCYLCGVADPWSAGVQNSVKVNHELVHSLRRVAFCRLCMERVDPGPVDENLMEHCVKDHPRQFPNGRAQRGTCLACREAYDDLRVHVATKHKIIHYHQRSSPDGGALQVDAGPELAVSLGLPVDRQAYNTSIRNQNEI